jgi:hypothetical protein
VILLSVLNLSSPVHPSYAIDPNYVLVYQSKYWDFYAYKTTWEAHKENYLSQAAYPDQVYEVLRDILGVDIIQDTPDHRLYLLIWEQTGGGFATGWIDEIGKGPGIGISFDAWINKYAGEDYWSHELIAHEATNVFTGHIVSGWPVDWWADELSPFPYAIKIKIEQETGHNDAAQASLNKADALVTMFLGFMSRYGEDIYAKMLRAIKSDGWTQWFGPNPSKNLSEYVTAYLSLAANASLADDINAAFQQVGIKYSLDTQNVRIIWAYRGFLQSVPRSDPRWSYFRQGILLVAKVRTNITLSSSPEDISMDPIIRSTPVVTINGRIMPAINTSVQVSIVNPSGTSTTETLQTSDDGGFSTSFVPSSLGTFTVNVSFLGDDLYESSSSELSVKVQPSYNSAMMITIALMIAVASYLIHRRGKTSRATMRSITCSL